MKTLNGFKYAAAAYAFKRTGVETASFRRRFDMSDDQLIAYYGRSVGISGNEMLVGSLNSHTAGTVSFLTIE